MKNSFDLYETKLIKVYLRIIDFIQRSGNPGGDRGGLDSITTRSRLSLNILFAIGISSMASYLGIAIGNDGLKYTAVIFHLYAIAKSITIISRFRHLIDQRYTLIAALVIFYPLIRIIFSVSSNPEFKTLTDALIIQGGYYELFFPGLAIAILAGHSLGLFVLYKYSIYALPVGVALLCYSVTRGDETNIGIGHTAINNCLLPASLLALYGRDKRALLIGWVAIFLVVFLSARIWSRSYTLVGVYLFIIALLTMFRTGRKKTGTAILVFIGLLYLGGGFFFLTEESVVQDASISDKYQFDSLEKSISQFLEDGDIVRLFNWEGNSRSEIIVDAFGSFDRVDWLFGKGLSGTYTSFVERSTIEIGWAQEMFRWGVLYTIAFLALMLYAYRSVKKGRKLNGSPVLTILAAILIIRFLDGFILGLPQSSVYNLLMFWGILSVGVKRSNSKERDKKA